MTTPTQLSTGPVFAVDFKVVRPLRAGGMGAVYVVEQLSTGKQREFSTNEATVERATQSTQKSFAAMGPPST